MSDQNAQTPAPQPSTGIDVNKIKEELRAEFEQEKKGIIRDLQAEREKRKELEAKVNSTPLPVPTGNSVGAESDPVEQLLADRFSRYAKPLVDELTQLKQQREYEKAFKFIGKKANLDPDEVPNSPVFKELVEVAQRYNLRGMSPADEARAAFELLEKERKAKEEAAKAEELSRNAAIAGNASVSGGVPQSGGPKVWSRKELREMPISEYAKYQSEIKAAEREGRLTD